MLDNMKKLHMPGDLQTGILSARWFLYTAVIFIAGVNAYLIHVGCPQYFCELSWWHSGAGRCDTQTGGGDGWQGVATPETQQAGDKVPADGDNYVWTTQGTT